MDMAAELSINTGPTVTVLHSVLAAGVEATGAEPLTLLAVGLTAATVAVIGLAAWTEDQILRSV